MASGQQQLTVDEIRIQNAQEEGAERAFKALGEIFTMCADDRQFLFGTSNFFTICNTPPAVILDKLNKSAELLALRVRVGDIIRETNDREWVITFVNDDSITFDAVCTSPGKDYGRTVSNVTLNDLKATRLDDIMTTYTVTKGGFKWV
jgi:hypothetical protein